MALVVNKSVLVVLSTSVENMFNCMQRCRNGGGEGWGPMLDCD